MNGKALVLIQGINKNNRYMMPKDPVIKAFFKSYDVVKYIDTESVFDRGWFSKMFDKLDFVPYFLNGKKRRAVCRLVNSEIARLKVLGYSVDVVAHSLGSVIAMQSGRVKSPISVRNMILLQSPMHHNMYGGYVRKQIKKYSGGLETAYLLSTYNKEDRWVANKGIKKFRKYIKSLYGKFEKFTQLIAGDGHDWDKALKELIIKEIV